MKTTKHTPPKPTPETEYNALLVLPALFMFIMDLIDSNRLYNVLSIDRHNPQLKPRIRQLYESCKLSYNYVTGLVFNTAKGSDERKGVSQDLSSLENFGHFVANMIVACPPDMYGVLIGHICNAPIPEVAALVKQYTDDFTVTSVVATEYRLGSHGGFMWFSKAVIDKNGDVEYYYICTIGSYIGENAEIVSERTRATRFETMNEVVAFWSKFKK